MSKPLITVITAISLVKLVVALRANNFAYRTNILVLMRYYGFLKYIYLANKIVYFSVAFVGRRLVFCLN